jgi:hypothetical protein
MIFILVTVGHQWSPSKGMVKNIVSVVATLF